MCRVFDDGDGQSVIVAQVTHLVPPLGYALDLLNLFDLEACVGAEIALDEQGDEDGPLRVRVDAAASAALEGCVEERGAGGWFVDLCVAFSAPRFAMQKRNAPVACAGTPWTRSP